jgi:hypothetical protein
VTKLFPAILIAMNICAAIMYAMKGAGEWRMVCYWSAAAVLNFVVTF